MSSYGRRMTEVEVIENIVRNRRKPKAKRIKYEGKNYIDVTDYWTETSFRMPELDGRILKLMQSMKSHAH